MDTDLVANEYVAFAVDIPDEIVVENVALADLPADWREAYPPAACQALGATWLEHGRSAILAVPSAIIPSETNYILNPRHPDFAMLLVQPPTGFSFDHRLWSR